MRAQTDERSSVALSAGGSTALVGAIGYDSYAGAGYVFTPGQRRLTGKELGPVADEVLRHG